MSNSYELIDLLFMKKLLFVFLLFCFPALIFAQKEKTLNVLMKDGTSVYFFLKEFPVATFADDVVKIVSATNEATIKRTLVEKMEFVDKQLPDASGVEDVEEVVSRDRFEITDNAIRIEGLEPGCVVRLFSISGQAIMSAVADDNGCVTLSLDALASGIYLVNYNKITIKFFKS